ncbi:uncharacterized protein LOC143888859 [Tasmannia lanceolata]|uniref:uncharacterized protein LOC143888859 n=1 Tax=Tasmannia lanceolata TaxID=3420 RepID=UPI0040639370
MDSGNNDARPSVEPSTSIDSTIRLLIEAFTNAEPSIHMDPSNIAPTPLVEPSTNFFHSGNVPASTRRRNSSKRRRVEGMPMPPPLAIMPLATMPPPLSMPPPLGPPIVLSSIIQLEQWDPMPSIVLTGAAKMGRPGPPVGLVNIGISKYAYLFQVALPGVSKDQSQFSCEVRSDGKVELRGWTPTGERVLRRDVSGETQVFGMKTQHLCESGPFKVSFILPGPVDVRLFKADYYVDGIFHAIVMKKYQRTNSLSTVPYTRAFPRERFLAEGDYAAWAPRDLMPGLTLRHAPAADVDRDAPSAEEQVPDDGRLQPHAKGVKRGGSALPAGRGQRRSTSRERGKRPFVELTQVESFPLLHKGPFRIYDTDAPRRTYVPPPSTKPLTTAPTHRASSIHMPSTSTNQRPPTDDTRRPSLDTGCRSSSSIPPHQPMPDSRVSLAREGNLMEVPVLLLDPALGYPNPKSSPGLPLRQGNGLLLMVESLKTKIYELVVDGERAKVERDTTVVRLAEVEARAKEVEDEARDLREAVSQRDETIMLQELRIRELQQQLHDEDCNVGGEESDSEATIST